MHSKEGTHRLHAQQHVAYREDRSMSNSNTDNVLMCGSGVSQHLL
jgi:hypothetical protein